MSVQVWLAEKAYGGPSDILGIFSKPERAKAACQDEADTYLGQGNTPTLRWHDYEGHSSASYHHPASGMWTFSVTRYTVDAKGFQQ